MSNEIVRLDSEKNKKNSTIRESIKLLESANFTKRQINNKMKKDAMVSKKKPGIEAPASLSRTFLSCSFGKKASIKTRAVIRKPTNVDDMLINIPELLTTSKATNLL